MTDKPERKKTGFCQQLRLLLWKNFTLKRRSPVVFALEVLIPLVLFIILVLIRRSEEPARIGITTFSPRALPSAGLIPVFQSFCDGYDEEVFNNTNERLTSFLETVQQIVEMGVFDDTSQFEPSKLPDQIDRIAAKLQNTTHGGNSSLTNHSFKQLPLNNTDTFNLLESLLKSPKDSSEKLLDSTSDLTQVITGLLDVVGINHTQLNTSNILGIWKTVMIASRAFPNQKCNQTGMQRDKKSSDLQTNFTKKYSGLLEFWFLVRPTLCGEQSEVADSLKQDRENITEKLNREENEMSANSKKHLSLLTRLLYGNPKILFAPNNTAATRIIQKVNETFLFYMNITSYARQWLNVSDEVRRKSSSVSDIYGTLLTPLYDTLDKLACAWLSVFDGIDLDVFKGFSSEAELERYFLNQQFHDNISVIAGLVFENLNDSTVDLPPHIRYKIRQNATFNPTTKEVRNKLWFPSPGSYYLKYYYFGFVWIQDLVERAMIDLQAERTVVEPGLFLHRMPYPCWLWGSFIWLVQHIVPLCFMLSWVYPVAMLVQRIVYEKEQRLKEVMKMMGLSNGVHWCAWFISAMIQMTLIMTILTLMMHYGKILPYSNPLIVFLYLELFALSSVAFSFLISSCFSKAKLAAACAGIFYFLAYIPYIYISIKEDISESGIMSASLKTSVSLFSTTALGLGGKYFLYYELEGVGCQWDNIMISPREHDQFTLFLVLLMMIVDSFIYFILAWYIENIHPGTYGLPKPWYFPFTHSYWCYGYTETNACSVKQLFGIRKKEYCPLDDIDEDITDSG